MRRASISILFVLLAPLHAVADEVADAAARMTRGAVPGEQLKPLTPTTLGGAARTNLLDYPFAIAAAYRVGDRYYNLDIKNTFHRGKGGDDSLEKMQQKYCPKLLTVGGYTACLRVSSGRASLRWYLPDRLTVALAAFDEATVRKLAAELPLSKLAALSRAK